MSPGSWRLRQPGPKSNQPSHPRLAPSEGNGRTPEGGQNEVQHMVALNDDTKFDPHVALSLVHREGIIIVPLRTAVYCDVLTVDPMVPRHGCQGHRHGRQGHWRLRDPRGQSKGWDPPRAPALLLPGTRPPGLSPGSADYLIYLNPANPSD